MVAASKRADLISRLDPQAQMSINPSGTYSTVNSTGTRVTAKPANVSAGVTHAAADIANPQAQAQYTMMQREQEAKAAGTFYGGGSSVTYADNNARRAAAGLPPETVTSAPPPGGGWGDGGGGGGVAPPPVAPTGPGGAGGDGTGDLLGQFTDQEIGAALAALEAQYGMTREQLLADQTLIGSQYRLLMARLNRQRQQSAEAVTSDAVSRGIYRSGIHGAGLLEAENQSMEQIREAEANQLRQEQGIQTQLSYLDAQKAAEGAGIEAGLRREQGNYHMNAGVPMPSQWGGSGGGGQGVQGFLSPPGGLGGAPGAAGAFNPAGGVGGVQPIPQPNTGAGGPGTGIVAPGAQQMAGGPAFAGGAPASDWRNTYAGLPTQVGTNIPLLDEATMARLQAQGMDPQSFASYGALQDMANRGPQGAAGNYGQQDYRQAQGYGASQMQGVTNLDEFIARLSPSQLAGLTAQDYANLQANQHAFANGGAGSLAARLALYY